MEYYVGLVLLIGLIGWFSVVYISKKLVKTILALIVLSIAMMSFVVYNENLGRPKSVTQEILRNDVKVEVLAYVARPNVALYVLFKMEGIDEPRYYMLPWNEQTQEMAQALQDGEGNGEPMFMSFPFEQSLSEDKSVHPNPPEMIPPKQLQEIPGLVIGVE